MDGDITMHCVPMPVSNQCLHFFLLVIAQNKKLDLQISLNLCLSLPQDMYFCLGMTSGRSTYKPAIVSCLCFTSCICARLLLKVMSPSMLHNVCQKCRVDLWISKGNLMTAQSFLYQEIIILCGSKLQKRTNLPLQVQYGLCQYFGPVSNPPTF